jgi:hypothetical protein
MKAIGQIDKAGHVAAAAQWNHLDSLASSQSSGDCGPSSRNI